MAGTKLAYRAAQPVSLPRGPGVDVVTGQTLALTGSFLARSRAHSLGHERPVTGIA